jgi:hypothetical protein
MSVPLSASHRITFSYTIDNLLHKFRAYCALVVAGTPTGYDVVTRSPLSNIGADVAIDAYLAFLAPLFRSTVSAYNDATLEQRSGTVWLPLTTYTPSVTPSGSSGAYGPAEQLTISMRDEFFHKVRQEFFEGLWAGPLKTNAKHGFGGPFDALADGLTTDPGTYTDEPWGWIRSRGGFFVQSFVSMVVSDNDKVRRARGLA